MAKEMTVPGVEKAENIVAEWKLQSSQLTLMAMGGLKVAGEHARAAETL